jgi:putative tryptophan/tyrosine transport system substrate-binding protein
MARPTGAPERVTIGDPTPAVIRELDISAARGGVAQARRSSSLWPVPALPAVPRDLGTGVDPVELGLVASLDRPGANVTGIANLAAEMAPKKLQLLRDLIPKAAAFGVLADPAVPSVATKAHLWRA